MYKASAYSFFVLLIYNRSLCTFKLAPLRIDFHEFVDTVHPPAHSTQRSAA